VALVLSAAIQAVALIMSRRRTPGRLAQSDTCGPYVGAVPEIFHITLPEHWARAQRDGAITMSTRDVTLAEEGFVHCSFAEQLAATAVRFFGDLEEVVVVRIDPAAVTSPVVSEDLYDSGQLFPHVYGPINVDAVIDARTASPLEL